jgi:hypothetical protein
MKIRNAYRILVGKRLAKLLLEYQEGGRWMEF